MQLGRHTTLMVWVLGKAGALLGNRHDSVLLPTEEVPEGTEKGDRLRVFVFSEPDGEPVATLKTAAAEVGELVRLLVITATPGGAFCDWGVPQDLFVPRAKQQEPLNAGDRPLVRVTLADDRLIGVTKLGSVLAGGERSLNPGELVQFEVYGHNDAGVLCVVESEWSGLLRDAPERLAVGMRGKAYVQFVHEDGRLDLSATPVGVKGIAHAVDVLWAALIAAGGHLPISDNSDPSEIRAQVGLSKKAFKRAVGTLYRQRKITLGDDGIHVASPRSAT